MKGANDLTKPSEKKVPLNKANSLRIRRIVFSGVIAALYIVLTLPFAQFAYGPVQFRLAELLTILPCFTGCAIPGVTIGCFIANLLNPSALGPIDIIGGSIATLLAAVLSRVITSKTKHKWLGIIPPIVINGLIVGGYLAFLLVDGPVGLVAVVISMLSVAASEAVLLIVLGLPFIAIIKRTKLGSYLDIMN